MQIDQVFLERKEIEEKASGAEDRVTELQGLAELRLNELTSSEKKEYVEVEQRVKDIRSAINLKMRNLEELSRKILEHE